jgi:uncharacterized protein
MSDLTDAEFNELDQLLERTPEPYRPLDVIMLDGYLCGVLVQPRRIEREDWLPLVFDLDGAAFPASADATWRARCEELVTQRHDALRESLAEDGWFDPLLPEPDEGPTEETPPELQALDPISRALMPWVTGFMHAAVHFPALLELADEDVQAVLPRLIRHLPPESDEERKLKARMDRERPLAGFEEAIEDMVNAVAELSELTHARRWHVPTVRRETPKVGRNDACPCGSGKKFKHCHGAR